MIWGEGGGCTEFEESESGINSFFTKIASFHILVCFVKLLFPRLGAVLYSVSHIFYYQVESLSMDRPDGCEVAEYAWN